jgi:aryl-phospho-beta-D-glucosidase BglC (GH1 family)
MRSLLLIFFLSPFFTAAQGLHAEGKYIVDKNGREVILRAIGLGGWMLQEPYMMQLSSIAGTQGEIRKKIVDLVGEEETRKFYASWLNNHCTKRDIDSLAAWGFNSVRLPMHFNLFTLPAEQEKDPAKDTWLEKGFALTDSLLKWCSAAKIYLILDLHAAPGGQGNDIAIADRDTMQPYLWTSDINQRKAVMLWKKLASRYANAEWLGAYDILNEPNYGFNNPADRNGCAEKENKPLANLYVKIIETIRSVDPNHMIIIEGNCWGNNYAGLLPAKDPNTVLSFHKYWNYNDPGSIAHYLKLREDYNMPIWCGETGENSNAWFTDAISLFEKNRIGWAMWPLKKNGLNNPLQIDPGEGYRKILKYWKGEGERPSRQEAVNALAVFSKQTNIQNNIKRRDVLDAMFRQPFDAAALPFNPPATNSSLLLFAVDYDLGRQDIAYHDNIVGNYWVSNSKRTDGNSGRSYRNDGVDIAPATDSISNGFAVVAAEKNEWLQYTISLAAAGTYTAEIRVATENDSVAELSLLLNDKEAISPLAVFSVSGKQWQTTSTNSFRLSKGINKIRLMIDEGSVRINTVRLTRKQDLESK